MAEEGIILPEEPLLIVERGWKRQSSRSTNTGQQTTRVDVLRGPSPTPSRDTSPGSTAEPRRRGSQKRRDFQFVAATETDGRHDLAAQKLVRSHVRKQSLRRDTLHPSTARRGSTPLISEAEASSTDSRNVTLATDRSDVDLTPHQSETCDTDASFEAPSLIDNGILIDIFFPLTRFVRFDPDPLRAAWFQNIGTDKLLSQSMKLVASVFSADGESHETLRSADLLMKSIHGQLIARIGQEHITDATVGSVMCLALAESQFGNGEKWAMHMKGLVNMLAVRGGVDTVDPMLRMQLYTVDVEGSADQLDFPKLQRPFMVPTVLEHLRSEPENTPVLSHLSSRLNSVLGVAFVKVFSTTQMLSSAISTHSFLDLRTWFELCASTHYDIFESPALSNLDQVYRYVMMLYMKTFSRTNPFTRTASLKTVAQLKGCLTALEELGDSPLALWALIIATIASLDTADREWFLQLMRQSTLIADCHTWEGLRARLATTPWIPAIHDAYGTQLWHALQAVSVPGS